MESKTKHRIHYAVSLVISLVLLLLVFRFVDFSQVLPAFLSLHWGILVLLLVLSAFVNVGMYCDRWRYMLSWLGFRHSLTELVRVHLGTGVLHLIMPIQTGEAVTAYALANKRSGPLALYFGTIAYGKYINLIVTMVFLLIGLILARDTPIPEMGIVILTAVGIMAVGLSLEIKTIREGFIRIASAFGEKPGRMARELFAVFSDFSMMQKIFLVAYSFVFKFFEVIICFILFRHLGIEIPFGSHMAICGLLILIGNIPVTVAGAGTREALCLLLLSAYTNPATAVAAGLLYTFIAYIWPMIIGLPWMRSVIADYLLADGETPAGS